jgi:hypothetical protein
MPPLELDWVEHVVLQCMFPLSFGHHSIMRRLPLQWLSDQRRTAEKDIHPSRCSRRYCYAETEQPRQVLRYHIYHCNL